MNIRNANAGDVDTLIEIERICFPPAEAAGPEALRARFAAFPECFFVAEEAGQLVGFINGCAHDAPGLPDELYHDASLHRPDGAYQTVFGLDVLPDYRGRGIAAALLRRMIEGSRARGRRGVVLTCKDALRPYYERFGFVWQGTSASTHGGASWNDMLLRFDEKPRGMKKLGLVGGMGPESTIPYYHGIVYGVQTRVGKQFFPNLTIESVNVFEVLRLCGEQKYEELTDYLMQAIRNLIAAGADFIALSANTPHLVFDRLQERSSVPLVSIVETARDEAVRQNRRKVGLMGTAFTMTADFFKAPFRSSGIEVVSPAAEEMAYIHDKISTELELGIAKEETLQGFQRIIGRMQREEGIEAIVLGCTELPLLLNDEVSPVPCLDTMKIHIQSLIDRIVE